MNWTYPFVSYLLIITKSMIKLSLRNPLKPCNCTNAFDCHFFTHTKTHKNMIQSILKSRKDLGALDQSVFFTDKNSEEQKDKDS